MSSTNFTWSILEYLDPNDASPDPLSKIKNPRLRNVNEVIIGYVITNSPNKFEELKELAMKHTDVLVITETVVCIGVPTPLKNNILPPLSCQAPLKNLQTVQAPLFRQSPLYISFLWTPPLKVRFFSEHPKY